MKNYFYESDPYDKVPVGYIDEELCDLVPGSSQGDSLINVMSQKEVERCMDKIRNGTPAEQAAATEEITIKNKPLIMYLIRKLYPTYIRKYWDDMISQGYIGIITALKSYDPKKSRLSTYLTPYIKHELSACICEMAHNTTPHYTATNKKIARAITKLHQYGIADPNLNDIMAETQLGADAIKTVLMMQAATTAMSLDKENVGELSSEEYSSPYDILEVRERMDALSNALRALPEEQRQILNWQYGLGGSEQYTQTEIASRLGKPVSMVHRLCAKAYRTLAQDEKLRSYYLDEYHQQQEINLQLEDVMIPFILSTELLEQEIGYLASIPVEALDL